MPSALKDPLPNPETFAGFELRAWDPPSNLVLVYRRKRCPSGKLIWWFIYSYTL